MLLSDFSSSCVCPPSSGVLCGECRNGSGVSALLNRCVTCSNAMGLLVAVLGEKRESAVGYCSVVVITLVLLLIARTNFSEFSDD